MPSLKRIVSSPGFLNAVGTFGAWYLRLVWNSSRVTIEPPDVYERADMPVIVAMWHGQHFLAPFIRNPNDARQRAKVLISRHRDGEVNARAAERLGIGTIRGSGSHSGDFHRKGGASAFKEMLDALADGYSVAMTADIPKISRVAGMGLVKLAQHSGRPIYPIALASSRRFELDTWDRTAVNLPFSRVALVACGPIIVPADADNATLANTRLFVEQELNRVTQRAYDIVDRKGSATP